MFFFQRVEMQEILNERTNLQRLLITAETTAFDKIFLRESKKKTHVGTGSVECS
jgi:hypothetical protein